MSKKQKKAVVLLNMGGISSAKEIEIFLTNMFNDKNIITLKSNFLRRFIAKMVVFFRLQKTKKNYAIIKNSSPILKLTKTLVKKIQKRFPSKYITLAMRYTPPYASEAIKNIKKRGINDIFLLPMYPQYSTTTVKSSLEDIVQKIEKEIPNAKITYINRFYENKKVIKLIVDTIEDKLPKKENIKDYNMIFSAHSLPKSIIENGDTYERELNHQIRLIEKEFKKRRLKPKDTILAYQSKLGPIKWLGPSLEHVVKNIPSNKKIKKAIIYPISFSIDNAETIYELAIEMKEIAKKEKYDNFLICKSFNANDNFVDIIVDIIK